MKFEKILQIVLVIAIVIQFFYSFILGRKQDENIGNKLMTLKRSAMKQSSILLLMICIVFYMLYAFVKGTASNTGLLIIIYFLISIYDFTKLKIVTDKGIGNKSLYNNSIYNFVYWEDITRWEWHPKHPNLLFFTFSNKKGNADRRDWDIPSSDKENFESILNKYVKHAFVDSTLENMNRNSEKK
ncbi:TPA: hypothetical protein ACXDAY_002871 [Clostridium botulinum]|uniref:hypothetical protein n=1 Tax=Clostridium botulinum TaxID=1491 RepID=UPI00016B9A1C|nr:hypothetical protein [Clostridium botulinum]EDT84045.1 hypothetical protein CBB_2058 [Clostridium botulinum Bf]EPS56368.1 hypothetical protein CLQ_12763 [Clostridium botulinum Af84]MBD5587168.1 hypothetical protein [Clostridium botulinum]MBN3351791.1 hypothetical protein [Clostridium botulinum]MBN3359508.1 hypothetical protein [Clostridium botulinum]